MKKRILIVDDVLENLKLLIDILREKDYEIIIAKNGQEALDIVVDANPHLILLDVNMPIKDGYEACRELKLAERTKHIPVIFLTALSGQANEKKGLELGAVDFIIKPFSPSIVQARVETHLKFAEYQYDLENIVEEKIRENEKIQRMTIDALAILAEYRDNDTGGHIKRTRNYMKLLAKKLQNHEHFKSFLSDKNIDILYDSAPLHDIGKVAIRDEILLKEGKLTDDEMHQMKKHAYYGYKTLLDVERQSQSEAYFAIAKDIAYCHHEKYDGTGYPRKLKGKDIPIPGRLMAVSDVYDALISKRCYKKPIPHSKSVEIIKSLSGSSFDPDIIDAFVELQEEFRETALKNTDYPEEVEALKS